MAARKQTPKATTKRQTKAKAGEVLSPLKQKSAAKAGKTAAAPKGATKQGSNVKAKVKKAPAKPRTARKAAVEREPAPKPVKFEKRFVGIARLMFLSKVSDKDIADSFGIDVETLEWWKEEHPDFGAAFRPDPRNYGGRPTSWDDRNITIANTLATLGATDLEIAQAFEVSIRTIHRWKLEYPEFREALEIGKEAADKKVEDSLYKRATGYSFDSEKIVVIEGEVHRAEIIEHVPPDTKAAMWWLQNRRPGTWRDVRHIKHDVEEEGALGGWLRELAKSKNNTFRPVEDDPEAGADVAPGGTLPVVDEDDG
ncbi:unknown [Sinorhizobium phage PBC5]|uniref:terminase small subunit n=1 Tax=Sinorhizobium phage PBC5 TaxID=179237 RepID=UPI000009B0D3|nr:terminase small subunit [Sinorhizobium phage PBC5]AAL49584.1 unknown [Sinorhizobium phage PBC5]